MLLRRPSYHTARYSRLSLGPQEVLITNEWVVRCFFYRRNSVRGTASTFQKTIAYRWSCWIVDSACDCTCISTNILSKIFQILELENNICPLLSRWSSRSTAILSRAIKSYCSIYLFQTDSWGSHLGRRYPRQFAAGILLLAWYSLQDVFHLEVLKQWFLLIIRLISELLRIWNPSLR